MKKDTQKILGIVLLAIGVIGFFGLIGSGELTIPTAILCICLIAGGIALIVDSEKSKARSKAEAINALIFNTTNEQTDKKDEKNEIEDGEKDYNLFPSYSNGQFLCYEYENQICFIKDDNIEEKFGYVIGNGGKQINFEFEPENQYDENAIAIYLDDKKLGYVYSGQTQDMIHDFCRKGWEVCAYINKYSKEDKKATYKIGFYKPIDRFVNKQFSLVKTKKKDEYCESREDNLYWCKNGDFATIELDDFIEENYVVLADGFREIGELPKSATKFIKEYNPKKIYGILDSCEEDENGSLKAKITVYLI